MNNVENYINYLVNEDFKEKIYLYYYKSRYVLIQLYNKLW